MKVQMSKGYGKHKGYDALKRRNHIVRSLDNIRSFSCYALSFRSVRIVTDGERQQIIDTSSELLENAPHGLRTNELFKRIRERHGPVAGDYHAVSQYSRQPASLFFQPARGWWRHSQFRGVDDADTSMTAVPSRAETILEQQFYEPFGQYLVEDLQECTKAIAVGGAVMKDRFGTPDVVGVYRPNFDDIMKFYVEVVSAEIKIASEGLITAFGQACAYKLFSHKSYIVVPQTALRQDIDKLESLCLIFGIGLILFDSSSPQNPNFQIRTRAIRHEPDMFYVNQKLRLIGKKLLG
jgi:hypothetical protein